MAMDFCCSLVANALMYRVLYAFSAAWGPTVGLLAGSSLCLGVAYAPGIPLILLGYRLKTDARRRMLCSLSARAWIMLQYTKVKAMLSYSSSPGTDVCYLVFDGF